MSLTLAKELLDWQKKQVEAIKKLPDFDEIILSQKIMT